MLRKSTRLYIIVFVFLGIAANAQQSVWRNPGIAIANFLPSNNLSSKEVLFSTLDITAFRTLLKSVPKEKNNEVVRGIPFSVPLPNGDFLKTSIIETSVWEGNSPLPDVQTYILTNPQTNSLQGRITVVSAGINGIIFSPEGTVYINPVNADAGTHMIYYSKNDDTKETIPCGVNESFNRSSAKAYRTEAGDNKRRTYRLAVATTGEYTLWAGNQTNALTYVTITINNIMAIYERDVNIRFSLISNNSIIFTDTLSDPYPGATASLNNAINSNQTVLDTYIGSSKYDLGIVLSSVWNGGLAYLGVVCNSTYKGGGAAGYPFGQGLNPVAGPQGSYFDLVVAHEIGHEFSAAHTFSSNSGACAAQVSGTAAFEPGAGSTIMSYANQTTCGSFVARQEPYFHAGSIAQIQNHALGTSCATTSTPANSAPVVSVPAVIYNVPVSTPFTLNGSAYDAEGNSLLFNWEQMDAAAGTAPPPANKTSGPNFRSYQPDTNGYTRTFPGMRDIATGISPLYEVLPSVNRTMHFRLTARDQSSLGGRTGEGNVTVNFNSSSGPFRVTSQPVATTWVFDGTSTQTITWNVAGTNVAPVNCLAVDIMFSVDGGITYPYTLLSNTTNDGSEVITIPNLATNLGRIKVQAVNNIFFNINQANISITTSCSSDGSLLSFTDSITAPAGHSSLNLMLNPQYGVAFIPSGTITSANPSSFLPIYNSDKTACVFYSNSFKYNVHPFVVKPSSDYTFTIPTPFGLVANLYNESFDPANPCQNFITSNTVSGSIGTQVSATLTAGKKYVLVVGTYSATLPALPVNYTASVSGGSIYTNTPNPGDAFSYMYVVVDNATNLIKAIVSNANLSDGGAYPEGTSYTVYGLSYSNASPTLNSYIGVAFALFSNALLFDASLCGNLSKNRVKVNIIRALFTFTGTGNWSDANNWSSNAIPPSPLPSGCEIIVDPTGAAESIINLPMTILPGGKLTIKSGKKLRSQGSMLIQN